MADESSNSNAGTVDAPDQGAIAVAEAKSSSQQDEVLARILADTSDESGQEAKASSSPGDRVRDEHGRFSPSKEDGETKKAEAKPKSEVPEGVKAEDYRKALNALQLDAVPQKTLDALEPNEIIAWGLKRAKNHADVDRLKSQIGELKKPKQETAPQASDSTEQPIDLSKAVEPVARKFAEMLGDDMSLAEPLNDFGKQVVEMATGQLKAKLAEQQAVIDSINGQFQRQQQEAARSTLTEKYELDKNERWQKVLERRQSDKNEYDAEADAIEAACRHEFADEIIAKYEANMKAEHKLRDKGQSTTQHAKTPPKSMTQDEQEDQILSAILDGDHARAAQIGRRANKSAGELMAQEI